MLPNIVFFEGRDATNATSLWETNGTQSGTFVVSNVASPPPLITREPKYRFVPGTASLDLTVFKSQVLFAGGFSPTITPVSIGPYTIWTSDGTADGTVPLIIAGAKSRDSFLSTVLTLTSRSGRALQFLATRCCFAASIRRVQPGCG